MATQTSNRNSEQEIHEAFMDNGMKISGVSTGPAGSFRLTKTKFEDGSWIQLFAENHHGRPAICITTNAPLSENQRNMARAAIQPIMDNLWKFTEAIKDANFQMRSASKPAKYIKQVNMMPATHGINISWNDHSFSKNKLYSLFEAIMMALPEIGLGFLTDSVLEDLRANYLESLEVA